jgi:hypothetical protein
VNVEEHQSRPSVLLHSLNALPSSTRLLPPPLSPSVRHGQEAELHGRLASSDNGARQGDQWVRGDLPVLPQHSLAADVTSPERNRRSSSVLCSSRERKRTSCWNKKQPRVPDAKPRFMFVGCCVILGNSRVPGERSVFLFPLFLQISG